MSALGQVALIIAFFAVNATWMSWLIRRVPFDNPTKLEGKRLQAMQEQRPRGLVEEAVTGAWRRLRGKDAGPASRDELLDLAGFRHTAGLEVLDAFGWPNGNRIVWLVLRGQAVDIDRTLAVAEFVTALSPRIPMPVFPSFDRADVEDCRSGEDMWLNMSGEAVRRLVVRGATREGQELIYVRAYVT